AEGSQAASRSHRANWRTVAVIHCGSEEGGIMKFAVCSQENDSPSEKLIGEALSLSLHREAEKGEPTKRLQFVADALVDAAIKGDVGAAKEIFDRIDGKLPQAVTGEDGATVTICLTLPVAWPAALLLEIGR